MRKMIIIDVCDECPNFDVGKIGSDAICIKTGDWLYFKKGNWKIPKSCPLEDYNGR
jgi:hypothetical protein